MMECLNGIIGITPELCDCLTNELSQEDIDTLQSSKSGLYLDDLPGGVDLGALMKSDVCKNLGKIAIAAMGSAAKAITTDLTVALNEEYKKDVNNFKGTIGQMSYAGTLPVTKQYQAFLLRGNDGTDTILTINRVGIIVNGSEALTVKIIQAPRNSSVGTVIKEIPVTSVANGYVWAIPDGGPLVLPLSLNGQPLDYYFVYDSSTGAGVAPKDNKIFCNCPGSKRGVITSYITPMGLQLDDLNNLSSGVVDKNTRGILLDAELKCSTTALVCGNFDSQEAVSVVLAVCMQYKTSEMLIEGLMKSREINGYVMQNKEYLWGKRNNAVKEYQNRIQYLVRVIDISDSNCFVCRDEQLYKSSLIVTDGGRENIYDARGAIFEANTTDVNASNPGVIPLPANYHQ